MDTTWARRVALARTVLGAGAVLTPKLMGTIFFNAEEASRPPSRALGRLFGIRDVALGVGALQAISQGSGEDFVRLGMACDVADVAAIAAGTGKLPARTVLLGAGTAALFAFAGWKALSGGGDEPLMTS